MAVLITAGGPAMVNKQCKKLECCRNIILQQSNINSNAIRDLTFDTNLYV